MKQITKTVLGVALALAMPVAGWAKPQHSAPVALSRISAGACVAMAPVGWQVRDINPQSSTLSVASPGGNLRATYGVVGVNSGQAAGYYGGQYRSADIFAQFLTAAVFGSEPIAKSSRPLGHGFQLIAWITASGYGGYTIFKRYSLPSDPAGYVVSVYIGGAPLSESKRLVPLAVGVATSIRCHTQLRPPPPNDFHPAQGAKCFGGECSEGDAVSSDVNATLGTAYVHDPNTGQGYYVGNADWNPNGKDGPGYYKQNGNDTTKLALGLQ